MTLKLIPQYESDYMSLVKEILTDGIERQTRNAVTKSVFGRILRVSPKKNEFPILSGRQMFYKGVLGELAAMLKGPKSVMDFKEHGCHFWDKFADPDGALRLDYGNAWLDFNGVNQLQETIDGIKKDPYGRRHIISGWRPDRIKELSLPCCHLLYQWYVRDGLLDMVWYQRSVDTMIGLPSDVIVAYMWNLLMANEVGLEPGEVVMMLGDTHIYQPHYAGAKEYVRRVQHIDLHRDGVMPNHEPCANGVWDFDPAGFKLNDYRPMSKIEFELLT